MGTSGTSGAIAVCALVGFLSSAHAETISYTPESNDYSARHGTVALQLGTAYSTKFALPIDLSALYAVGDHLFVHGRLSYSPVGDIHSSDAGAGATLCLLTTMTRGKITLSSSPISTKWMNLPDAALNCLGIGGGALYQHFTVQATNPNPPPATVPEVFAPADTLIFHGGIHVLRRQDVAIRSDGELHRETALRKIFVEAMIAPKVSGDLPAGVPEPTYKKFGGRIGIENAYGPTSFNWAYRVEAGLLPGSGDSLRIYLLLSVGFGLAL